MAIFYMIHHLPWGESLSEGTRNCRTFLMGCFIYICIGVAIMNCKFKMPRVLMWDAVLSGLVLMFLVDLGIMGYLYRKYFGRSIVNEIGDDKDTFVYDSQTHTYRKLNPDEILAKDLEVQRKIDKLISQHEKERERDRVQAEAQQRLMDIITTRERIRSAKTIQRWWREYLYKPKTGIFYLRAKQRFEELQNF